MSVLPPPPTDDWAAAINAAVESLLARMEAVERVTHIVSEQAEINKHIRELHEEQNVLNDSLLITPATTTSSRLGEISKKRKVAEAKVSPLLETILFKPYD